MKSIFNVLENIRQRPNMYLRSPPADRFGQIRELEMLVAGYKTAVFQHDIPELVRDFSYDFGEFLYRSREWSASTGPFNAIACSSSTGEEAWELLWKCVAEFKASLPRSTDAGVETSASVRAPSMPRTDDRDFQVWEYQIGHGQLLIRSPKSPATASSPERRTNIDLVFLGVEYMRLPSELRGLTLAPATAEELQLLEAALGRAPEPDWVRMLVSGGKRFTVVAARVISSENDWDIFDSPFELRSQFRVASK